MTLLERFEQLELGTKITAIIEGYFGIEILVKATYARKPEQHGYIAGHGGSWGLYKTEDDEVPCHEIGIRPYRKHHTRIVKLNYDLLDFEEGWKVKGDD